MSAEEAKQYHVKISALMVHNTIFIEPGLFSNVTYVLQGMALNDDAMRDGFNELKFWFCEGWKANAIPPVLFAHIMRYVDRGIKLFTTESAP